MANPFSRFFRDLGKSLGFWDESGNPTPPVSPRTQSNIGRNGPPFLSGRGSLSSGFDDEVRWLRGDKNHRPSHIVGSDAGAPSIGGIRDLFDASGDQDLYTIIIGGDTVDGDTGSLGSGGATQYRGYKVQGNDLQRWLGESRDADEFASKVAPPGRGWHGVHIIEVVEPNED